MIKKILLVVILILCIFAFAVFIRPNIQTPESQLAAPTHSQALLLHGYWLSQVGDGKVDLSLRSEFEVKAGALLYQNQQVDTIVIDAGPIWGIRYLTLGQRMKQELLVLGVPEEKIILQDNAMDTYEEIVTFLDIAKQNGWTNIADLAFSKHDLTIPTLYKNQHAQATYLTVEDVLQTNGSDEDKQAIKNFSASIYDFNFMLYEGLVQAALLFDPNYKILGAHARNTRVKKSSYGGVPFFPVDKYDL